MEAVSTAGDYRSPFCRSPVFFPSHIRVSLVMMTIFASSSPSTSFSPCDAWALISLSYSLTWHDIIFFLFVFHVVQDMNLPFLDSRVWPLALRSDTHPATKHWAIGSKNCKQLWRNAFGVIFEAEFFMCHFRPFILYCFSSYYQHPLGWVTSHYSWRSHFLLADIDLVAVVLCLFLSFASKLGWSISVVRSSRSGHGSMYVNLPALTLVNWSKAVYLKSNSHNHCSYRHRCPAPDWST